MAPRRPKQIVFVVMKLDQNETDPNARWELEAALPTLDEAHAAAARLNASAKSAGSAHVSYEVQKVRFYPEGRNVQVGY